MTPLVKEQDDMKQQMAHEMLIFIHLERKVNVSTDV